MVLETERLLLRPLVPGDLKDVHEYCRQPGIGESAGWPHHKSERETKRILLLWIMEGYRFAIVYKSDKKVVGHFTVNPDSEGHNDVREIGFVINENYHNRGIISEIFPAVRKELSSLNVTALTASCYQNNYVSRHVLEKLGFRLTGSASFYHYGTGKQEKTLEYEMKL